LHCVLLVWRFQNSIPNSAPIQLSELYEHFVIMKGQENVTERKNECEVADYKRRGS